MLRGLRRFQESGQSHFVRFSCDRRQPSFALVEVSDVFVHCLEKMRRHCGEPGGLRSNAENIHSPKLAPKTEARTWGTGREKPGNKLDFKIPFRQLLACSI